MQHVNFCSAERVRTLAALAVAFPPKIGESTQILVGALTFLRHNHWKFFMIAGSDSH